MITKEQIIDIAKEELTPIGWHEEQAKYIDGLDVFAERLVKLCNISHVSNSEAVVCSVKQKCIHGAYCSNKNGENCMDFETN